MQQALGNDNYTHGGHGANLNPFGSDVGLQNVCGDAIRAMLVDQVQSANCAPDYAHGKLGDAHGAPDFTEWPTWGDVMHQKMWVDWIRRSYLGGLRVMVALATNNKTLGDMAAGPGDFPTDDKSTADFQIAETKSFVNRHSDFMEIANSPADLERIVRANKLAVVLGIEVDNIGNFNKSKSLSNVEIRDEIDRLFNEGVRYIFPIHVLDNSFGGTAAYVDLFNYSNYRETGHWWDLGPADSSIDYKFQAQGLFPISIGRIGSGAELSAAMAAKIGIDFALAAPPTYPQCGQKNKKSLSTLGEFAIKEMMRHGMLIDIDHMSELSQNKAISLAEAVGDGYPLNSGHSNLRGPGSHATERNLTANQYAAIGRLHGMAGIGSCSNNAAQWIGMYQGVLQSMGANACCGFGTDTDGVQPGMPPRPGSTVHYDDSFPRSSLGTKSWDYNKDGVAHYGMLPDFLRDVGALPSGNLVTNNLMSGADYFLQTWKKSELEKTKVN
jgi:microsomal dipeptidase-like Zn-dependent dipeptidase